MKPILGLAAAAALLLAGCETGPIDAGQDGITLRGVTTSTLPDAEAVAQAHCSQFDLEAERTPEDIADGRVSFRCVGR